MSDNYQAVYDAVRSRFGGCDVGSAIESAIRSAGIGDCAHMVQHSIQQAASAYEAPSAIYRPKIYIDGSAWCALYGDNIQDGVAGFGDSPAQAMDDFDRAWYAKLAAEPVTQEKK